MIGGLARQRECHGAFSGDAQPRVTRTVPREGYAHGKAGSRLRTGRDVRISGADHCSTQCRTGRAGLVQSGHQPQMLGICRKARLPRVRPADLLEPGWEIGILQVGMVAAVTTDQLERAGAAAHALMRDPDPTAAAGLLSCRGPAGPAEEVSQHRPRQCGATGHQHDALRAVQGRRSDEQEAQYRSRRPGLQHYSFNITPGQRFASLPGSGAGLSSDIYVIHSH
jgi:hypothetical protein